MSAQIAPPNAGRIHGLFRGKGALWGRGSQGPLRHASC